MDARFDREMQALMDDQRKSCPKCEAEMVRRRLWTGLAAGRGRAD